MRARIQIESGALLMRRGDARGRSRIEEGVALAQALGMRGVAANGRARLERPGADYSTMTSPVVFGCWMSFSFTVPGLSNLWV